MLPNTKRKSRDKADIIGANPLIIGIIARGKLNTGQRGKDNIDVGSNEEGYLLHFHSITVCIDSMDSITRQLRDEAYTTLNIRPPYLKYRMHHTLHIQIAPGTSNCSPLGHSHKCIKGYHHLTAHPTRETHLI